MAVIEETTTIYRCSDGSAHLNKLDADIHEADLALKAACDEHGYSGPSFSRADEIIERAKSLQK